MEALMDLQPARLRHGVRYRIVGSADDSVTFEAASAVALGEPPEGMAWVVINTPGLDYPKERPIALLYMSYLEPVVQVLPEQPPLFSVVLVPPRDGALLPAYPDVWVQTEQDVWQQIGSSSRWSWGEVCAAAANFRPVLLMLPTDKIGLPWSYRDPGGDERRVYVHDGQMWVGLRDGANDRLIAMPVPHMMATAMILAGIEVEQ
jgi:hypothetical protein